MKRLKEDIAWGKSGRMILTVILCGALLLSFRMLSLVQAEEQGSAARGATLFEAHCAKCHTIGGGNRPAGPDLKDVTANRERDWLIREIVEPDKLLAEKDPVATKLRTEFHNIPMPNRGLSKQQAEDLLDYIKCESDKAVSGKSSSK